MKIKMELLSDAIPGSGEGTAGLVDTDIAHDEFGLPFIPAKRIKGILRESARDLEDVNILPQGRIEELFGKRGEKIGTAFKISDGHLEDHSELRQFLQFCSKTKDKDLSRIFNREAVLSFYTYTRSQTSIDAEKGTAQNDTLRTFRVLKKGLKFAFDTEFPAEWEADMDKICKVTRKFGISRTRGTGELCLTIDKSNHVQNADKIESDEKFEDEDICRLDLKIHNIGQLIVTVQVGKDQISENYIPGTFILGAMANAFMKHFNLDFSSAHHHQDFRDIFLNGDIIFSNAYLSKKSGKNAFYPCPASIVREKDKEEYFDMADEDDFNKVVEENIQTKGNIAEFVQMRQGEVSTQSVLNEVVYHHWRPNDRSIGHAKKGAGEFFQFTVIKADQDFVSHITGKYKYIKILDQIIGKRKIYYLGKSRTAQYGKCEIEKITIEKMNDLYNNGWQKNKLAVFTLESDMILRNDSGFVTPDPEILKNEIAEMLKTDKKNIVIEKSFLKFKQIGGYSGVWNMPKIQTPALAAGSVIVCKNSGDDLPDISFLENHSFGIRTEEGFGKIKVNWHGQDQIVLIENSEDDSASIPDHIEKSKDLIQHILYGRLEDALKNKPVQNGDKTGKPSVSNSFMGKMILFVKTSKDFDELNRKFSELKERAVKQLDKLERDLFLREIKEEYKTVFETDKNTFIKELDGLRDSAQINRLRSAILPNAGMTENFYEDKIFNLYQTYAIHFLTLLRLHNRKAGNHVK